MKLMMVIACGAVAACASNKPPEDATNESASTTTTSPQANSGYQANAENGPTATTTPAYNSTPSTASNSGATDQSPTETGAGNASAVPPPPPQDTSAMASPPAAAPGAPDNSRVNKRDRGSASPPTPMDQGNGASDLKITQQIRQAVVGDSSLSFTAKNVKIITSNGKVTLRGPVKSDQERQAIEASARKVAGENVDNQLEVKK